MNPLRWAANLLRHRGPRVVVVNARGGQNPGPAWTDWLLACKPLMRPLVALVSEADGRKFGPWLDEWAPTHNARVFRAVNVDQPTHGALEVGVIVVGKRAVTEIESARTFQLTDNVNPPDAHGRRSEWAGMGHDRWATEVLMTHRGVAYAFLSLHAPESLQTSGGLWRDNPGAQQWRRKGLPHLAETILHRSDQGYTVVLGGDLNAFDTASQSPEALNMRSWAAMHGLGASVTRVLWLLATKGCIGAVKVLPRSPGGDHPGELQVDLKAPKKEKA